MVKLPDSQYSLPQIENYFSQVYQLAKVASQKQEVPIAAVMVYKGEVIASNHNRVLEKKDPTAHAELLVIQKSSQILQNERLLGCELFVSLEPCVMCAGAIHLARLHFVHYLVQDLRWHSFEKIQQTAKLNHYCGFACYPHFMDAKKLLSDFFANKRKEKKQTQREK